MGFENGENTNTSQTNVSPPQREFVGSEVSFVPLLDMLLYNMWSLHGSLLAWYIITEDEGILPSIWSFHHLISFLHDGVHMHVYVYTCVGNFVQVWMKLEYVAI